jgi:isoamylase
MHVRGFTRHPSRPDVGKPKRGTYAGLIEKIPYLQDSASPPSSCCRCSSSTAGRPPGRVNYWGYAPVSRSSPRTRPTARGRIRSGPLDEFRDMVKALHRAGIEVILDVVFNHTAEGNETGPRSVSAASTTTLLHPRTDRPATRTTPAAATRSTRTTRSSAA